MTTTPLEQPVPQGHGRSLYAALGYAIRGLKALPAPVRESVLDRAMGGMSGSPPPFPDVLRIVESAGGIPNGKRWQQRLLLSRPDLRGVRIRDIEDETDGRLRVRLYLPPEGAPAPTAAFVWVHGGAFVLGSLDQQEAHWPSIELAATGIPVVSVDYRLCFDGRHYPLPHDDVLTAWRWATTHANELGVRPDQLHLGGASAGGCLAASVALRVRDDHGAVPASLYLAYPVLQGVLPPASPEAERVLAGLDPVPDGWLAEMFANWAGSADWESPYVSPGSADLVGLPPTYVLTCGRDTLRRASEPFAVRLGDEGVTVRHEVFEESEHAPLDRPGTSDGECAVRRLRTWLLDGVDGMSR